MITELNSLQRHYTITFTLLPACLYHSVLFLHYCLSLSTFLTHCAAFIPFFPSVFLPPTRLPLLKKVLPIFQNQHGTWSFYLIPCFSGDLIFLRENWPQLDMRSISAFLLRSAARVGFYKISSLCMSPLDLKMAVMHIAWWY